MKSVLKIKKLHPDAVLPSIAKSGDAGFDLCVVDTVILAPHERKQVPTGLAMEIPDGCAGLIWDKSGLSHKYGIKTLGGVVDSGYRGEVMVGVVNLSDTPYTFEKGHKVAQMIIQKFEAVEIVEVDNVSETERGESGFGSTGK